MITSFRFVCAAWRLIVVGSGIVLAAHSSVAAGSTPKVGDAAPNFTLRTLEGRAVELHPLVEKNPVVLVMLRGWPGYQCPICTRQVQEFVASAAQFSERNAKVVMVYPGPAESLKAHADEFLQHKQWPADFIFVLDPDYGFTNAYGLRWDAPKETAYPATFVIARGGVIQFAQVSRSHGNRLSSARTLEELK